MRTRPNPDRGALARDVVAHIDPGETEFWRERWESAMELLVDDVQAQLLEGLRDFGQQFQDALAKKAPALAHMDASDQAELMAWLATAPASFRVGGPLERGRRDRAVQEWAANYVQFTQRIYDDLPQVQDALRAPALLQWSGAFFERVLRHSADVLDKGVDESFDILWAFDPLREALRRGDSSLTPEQLRDDLRERVLAIFPTTTAGDPIAALRQFAGGGA